MRPPTFHKATKLLHCSVEGEDDSLEVFTSDAWHVFDIREAEIVHRDYIVRNERSIRWHPKRENT